ncbi:uncharacterized protein LOC115088205 isoform X2 [Rhinatrema bivittatum]|uniref:uncharacterized protein LOC115088205 isoform X2 n=1 Tax=Rhinatrema bivittatum TaxID=194408 RepID=UPI00112E7093|nr:uncharacterized protein LOC115088205 isoform X2 [Rhinatrema bivittatum]
MAEKQAFKNCKGSGRIGNFPPQQPAKAPQFKLELAQPKYLAAGFSPLWRQPEDIWFSSIDLPVSGNRNDQTCEEQVAGRKHGSIENKHMEGNSQTRPDTTQDFGKETAELIAEIAHLKSFTDPLVLDLINTLTQQVRTCLQFISKINQLPQESEQVRKQNQKTEESCQETQAVLGTGDGHKWKSQIPPDACARNGKGCGLQPQGELSCMSDTVFNVQVLVTGKTFGSEQQFLHQVEVHLNGLGIRLQKEDYTPISDKLLLLFCPVISRAGTDINHILETISSDRKVILVVMHYTPNQTLQLYVDGNWIQHSSLIKTVHCRFSEGSGLYSSEMNTNAIISVASKLQQQHGSVKSKIPEESSQKQPDGARESGNKTEELISEITHLKSYAEPLVLDLINSLTRQVRTYLTLLSKINQLPQESEQVRKQNQQTEESSRETQAAPKTGDGQKKKSQIPPDAYASNGKGCGLQPQGEPSCLPNTVFNVQVLVTGKTFGSEQQFLRQVEVHLSDLGIQLRKEDYTPISDELLLLFCPVSWASNDIKRVLEKISSQRKVILVAMHYSVIQILSPYGNRSQIQHGSLISRVDCCFSEKSGLYSCQKNFDAITSVVAKIQQQHGDIEKKNLTGHSQKQPDTPQEIGNKTEELILEVSHLKSCKDPLVLDLISTLTQQVRICSVLLSKINQLPQESEPDRKQNQKAEESSQEIQAVHEVRDGQRGKYQTPLEATASYGKGCSSQHQGAHSCLSYTVFNVQVLVTGQTFGSEQQFLSRTEVHLSDLGFQLQKEDYTPISDKLLLLFCPVVSRAGTDINHALETISSQRKVILVVMHCTPNQNLSLYVDSSRIQHGSLISTVDCRFSEASGLYNCRMNTEAIMSVVSKIQEWQENLREKM